MAKHGTKGCVCMVVVSAVLSASFDMVVRAEPSERGPEDSAIHEEMRVKAQEKLSRVKVGVVYESVLGGRRFGRSTDDMIEYFKETGTDFIFRGFWRWRGCPEDCFQISELAQFMGYKLPADFDCEKVGYTYKHLREIISQITEELPDAIFCGGIQTFMLQPREWNPMTGKGIADTSSMVLDPGKWGLAAVTKEELQRGMAKRYGWEYGSAYYPDLTNPEYQELLTSWAKKQIDCGVDAIWIDLLHVQVGMLYRIATMEQVGAEHPAVKESVEAIAKIIDDIHGYGYSKGKYVHVGSWIYPAVDLPYPPPGFDFVTANWKSDDMLSGALNEEAWDTSLVRLKEVMGDIPLMSFFDWGFPSSPVDVFSQQMSKDEQSKTLKWLDEFFRRKGVLFLYPMHGGVLWMGKGTVLSFGKFPWYDALAPEFETYNTIRELALERASCGTLDGSDN